MVHHPPHYAHAPGFEPIDVIVAWKLNFPLGSAIKYIARHQHKGEPLQDLEKARWYLNWEIERMKREAEEQVLTEEGPG